MTYLIYNRRQLATQCPRAWRHKASEPGSEPPLPAPSCFPPTTASQRASSWRSLPTTNPAFLPPATTTTTFLSPDHAFAIDHRELYRPYNRRRTTCSALTRQRMRRGIPTSAERLPASRTTLTLPTPPVLAEHRRWRCFWPWRRGWTPACCLERRRGQEG